MLATVRQQLANFIYPEGPLERRSIERQLDVDPLTGVGNRRALQKALASDKSWTMVAIFDLNNLGKANKELGHEWGDRYIDHAAQIIAQEFPRVFRFGGDEFVVLDDRPGIEIRREMVERNFGSAHISGRDFVSLTGATGLSLAEADSRLQRLKRARKARD